jgi:hypothetical protein
MPKFVPKDLPRKTHRIATVPNFTFTVYDAVRDELKDGNGNVIVEFTPTRAYDLEISRWVLERLPHFASYFRSGGPNAALTQYDHVEAESPAAWKLLLQVLHGPDHGCFDESSYRVSILTIWNTLDLTHEYEYDPTGKKMKDWFAAGYDKNKKPNTQQCRELLYPALVFDHAQVFATVSKQLAYNVPGHIEERMPKGFDTSKKQHHLPNNRMIGTYSCNLTSKSILTRPKGHSTVLVAV